MKKNLPQSFLLFAAILFFGKTFSQQLDNPVAVFTDPVFPSIAVNPAVPVFATNDVSFLNQDTAVAVGNNGMVWRSIDGGLNWSVMAAFSGTNHNNSVIMKDNYICIAGDLGTVSFSSNKGVSWSNASAALPAINYHGVHFADTTFGASVGDNGDAVIYHWVGGLGWAHIPTALSSKLNAVAAYKTSLSVFQDGFALAAGDNGALATYAFGSWTSLPAPGTTNINGLYLFPDNVTVLAVGDSGLIMRSTNFGTSWSVINYGNNEALRDISPGISVNEFIAVGDSGLIYESTDGGFSFTRYTVGFNTTNLRGISAKTPRGAFGGSGNTLRIFTHDSTVVTGVNDSLFCSGDNFKVYIKLFGQYGSSNLVSLELSDASGSFTSPVVIGTKLNPQPVDSITGIIPANTAASLLYKIRISTADPFILSNVYASSFTVLPGPIAQTVQVNVTDLFVNNQAGCTYQWYYNTNPMSGETDTIVTTIGNGNYYVTITYSNGCSISTNVFNYTNTSIKNSVANTGVSVSPNPASNVLNVQVQKNLIGKNMFLYDISGKKVMEEKIRSLSNQFNTSEIEPGLYFLTIENRVTRVVINK
ncbi:MAG: T9SS type A sorting domain-containing protein [Bacteroidia bacterium]|nr:T9SS type A sorting domain-containing protein [Bacteroidia bacterium]